MIELNFTLVYFAVSFIAFMVLMKVIFFDKVAKVIASRENLITENLKSSQLTSKQMEEQMETSSSSSILKSAKDEAQSIINQANLLANNQKNKILESARVDLQKSFEQSLKEMDVEKQAVIDQMDSIVNEISTIMTSKLLDELNSGKKAIGV